MAGSGTTYLDLPPECLLRIISFLASPAEVIALLRTSRLWHSVITSNEQVVYHQIANKHDRTDVSLGALNDVLKNWASPNAKGIRTWKQYCQLQVATERRWNGKSRAYSSPDIFEAAQQTQVHRIKIDTEKSLLVMSGQGDEGGCLVVHCLQKPAQRALFCLDQISSHAHVEMSDGFVVFTCGAEAPDSLEVWRWAEDQDSNPLSSSPTEQQQRLYENAMINSGYDSPRRGVLVPMGVLKHSDATRASRFVFPTVCVGTHAGDQLCLWDIRTRKLTQTIEIEPSPYVRFRMNYVDVNETHIFVATHTVSVYSRATRQRVFHLDESHLAQITTYISVPTQMPPKGSVFTKREIPGYNITDRLMISGHRPWDVIMAVHVSPSGNDFVAITSQGHIFHMSGLKSESVESGGEATQHSQVHLRISVAQAQSCLENLAFDGQRILAYGDMGLCLLNLEDKPRNPFIVPLGDGVAGELYPFPTDTLNFVYPFGGTGQYGDCSCLQMTRDTCWVAWMAQSHQGRWHDLFGSNRKTVGVIDFTKGMDDGL